VTTYDAALPKGTEPRAGHKPRPRTARAGSALDEVYASRYTRLEGEVAEGVTLELVADPDDNGPILTDGDLASIEDAIADETPPEARHHVTDTPGD